MTRIVDHLRRQGVAYLALFVALGGTGYAATRLSAGSVGTRALRNHSVTPVKFGLGTIAGYMRAYAQINGQGRIVASRPGAKVITWRTTGPEPGGLIEWKRPIPASCFAEATTNTQGGVVSYASAQLASAGATRDAQTAVLLSVVGQPVSVAVMCPQP